MAKTRIAGLVLCCTLATSVWAAEASSPTLIVTPAQPKWSDLSVPQRIVLAPLSDDWDSFENFRQKKWLSIAARFPGMTQEEQRRILKQMQEWGKLTPEQRQLARENFKAAKQLPAEKKQKLKQKWEEYASLPPEEKERLKQQAANLQANPAISIPKPILPTASNPLTPLSVPPAIEAQPAATPPAPIDGTPIP